MSLQHVSPRTIAKGALGILLLVGLGVIFQGTTSVPSSSANFLFVAKRRHHLINVVKQLQRRRMFEFQLPQDDKEQLWNTVSTLAPREWSLLWSFQAIRFKRLPQLSPHHRVNHIPGNNAIVIKPQLWKTHISMMENKLITKRFMPHHFILPGDLPSLKKAWSHSRWITKSVNHRGIRMLPTYDSLLDLAKKNGDKAIMVAEFIEPVLVDQRKWDVGVYAAVTSLSPLTIWIYRRTCLLRFCKELYPKNGKINENTPLNAYVVNDYLPPWELPSLKAGYEGHVPSQSDEGTNTWEVLKKHLLHEGHDQQRVDQMWVDIEKSIVATIKKMAIAMRSKVNEYGGFSNVRSLLSFFSFDSPYLFFVVPFVFDVMLVLLLPLILFVL